MTTKYQREQLKEELEKAQEETEAHADNFLDRLILSKWTAPILIGVGVSFVLFLLLGIF